MDQGPFHQSASTVTYTLILLLIFLIFLSGYFSAAETAFFSISPLTLKTYRANPNPRLNLISRLMENPRQILVTFMILHILANILVQNVFSSLFAEYDDWTLKIGIPLILTLVFGDVLPKSIAMPYNTKIAFWIGPVIEKISSLMGPVREILTWTTTYITRVLFFFLQEEKEISFEELKHVLKTSQASGVLVKEEAELIEGMLDLEKILVKERMRPREEILFYDLEQPISELNQLFMEQEITRIPVCDGSLENVLGVLSTRIYFFLQNQIQSPSDLLPHLKKPFYIPETTKGWTLLKTLREKGESLALVVNEYGSISGLVTQEDLIEGVVGEITDRRDEKSLYTRSGPDVIIASGKLELSELEEIFGVALISKGNVVTLGGWLIEQLADIPVAGTKYATDQFLFYILAADPNRIRRIYVRYLRPKEKR